MYDREYSRLTRDKWLHKLKLKQVLVLKRVLKTTALLTTLQIVRHDKLLYVVLLFTEEEHGSHQANALVCTPFEGIVVSDEVS